MLEKVSWRYWRDCTRDELQRNIFFLPWLQGILTFYIWRESCLIHCCCCCHQQQCRRLASTMALLPRPNNYSEWVLWWGWRHLLVLHLVFTDKPIFQQYHPSLLLLVLTSVSSFTQSSQFSKRFFDHNPSPVIIALCLCCSLNKYGPPFLLCIALLLLLASWSIFENFIDLNRDWSQIYASLYVWNWSSSLYAPALGSCTRPVSPQDPLTLRDSKTSNAECPAVVKEEKFGFSTFNDGGYKKKEEIEKKNEKVDRNSQIHVMLCESWREEMILKRATVG